MGYLVKFEEAESYCSKRFDILCERNGNILSHTLTVIDNITKKSVEVVEVDMYDVHDCREQLVMKYLLLWAC